MLLSPVTARWIADVGTRSHRVNPICTSSLNFASPVEPAFNMPLDDPLIPPESFTVPVYEASQSDLSEPVATPRAPSIFSSYSSQLGSQSNLSMSTAGLSLDMMAPSLAPRNEQESAPQGTNCTIRTPKVGQQVLPGQSQRSHERLLKQIEQTEAENEKLREANRANRADLVAIQKLVEQVLVVEDLSAHAYNSLSQVADSLMVIKQRLL